MPRLACIMYANFAIDGALGYSRLHVSTRLLIFGQIKFTARKLFSRRFFLVVVYSNPENSTML